jgi:hypothetical protein
MEGPVILADLGLTFTKGQIRDLDLMGRENAEKSNDIRIALTKGWLAELNKDPSPAARPDVAEGIRQAAERVAGDAERAMAAQRGVIEKLEDQNRKLAEQLERQAKNEGRQAEILDKTTRILAEVKSFAERDPVLLRSLKETMENIVSERTSIREASEEAKSSGVSEKEIEAQERILKLRDQKLEKNFEQIGKTISKEADSVEDALSALDQLGF